MFTPGQWMDLAVVGVIFGVVLYWIFVTPERARRQRREELNVPNSHLQPWDPDITARRRHR